MKTIDFIGLSNKTKWHKAVFIIGMPRSGTSLLYRRLQKHSMFKPKEENLVEANIFRWCGRAGSIKAANTGAFKYMMKNELQFVRFLDSIRLIRLFQHLMNKTFVKRHFRRLNRNSLFFWKICLNAVLVRIYFHYALLTRGGRRILEKTPNNTQHVEKIRACFPNCKMICIIRHPVDTFSSYRKRLIFEDLDWLKKDMNAFCSEYAETTRIVQKYKKKYANQFFVILYEEMVNDSYRTFKFLSEALEVPFEKGILTEENEDLKKWPQDPHLYGEITPKTKNWRDYLSYEEAAHIELQLSEVMDELGYEKYAV